MITPEITERIANNSLASNRLVIIAVIIMKQQDFIFTYNIITIFSELFFRFKIIHEHVASLLGFLDRSFFLSIYCIGLSLLFNLNESL